MYRSSVQAAKYDRILALIVRQLPLVAILIMTGAKEELRWRLRGYEPRSQDKEVDVVGSWDKQAQDFSPGHCSLCPIPNLNSAVSSLNFHNVTK